MKHQKKALTIREPDSDDSGVVSLLNRIGGKLQPIMVELTLNGEKTEMELDTGAAVSVISSAAHAGQAVSSVEAREHISGPRNIYW